MQRGRRAQKHKIELDGIPIEGLVNIAGLMSEKKTVEVSDGGTTTTVSNGDKSVPPVEMTLLNLPGSDTKERFRSWYDNNELHDLTVIYMDGQNTEFERKLYKDCECIKFADPDNDQTAAVSSTFDVSITAQFLPETIV